METNDGSKAKQASAFTVINNVCDHCKQPPARKLLMMVLARHCDRDGKCFPNNKTLATKLGVSDSTIHRFLRQLAKDGEFEILRSGRGRDQRRYIRLTRYVGISAPDEIKGVIAVTPSNVSHSDTQNNHSEQPTHLKMNTHVSLKRAGVSFDLSGYSEEERHLIDIYHRLVWQKDKRWSPVDTYTDEVSKALALYEGVPEEFEDLCRNALKCGFRNPHGTDPYDFDTYVRIPARRTLVRLIWENY
jgi:hypothetical protein